MNTPSLHTTDRRAPSAWRDQPVPGQSKRKLLIFVIAYYAEDTLKSVLERIPPQIFEHYHCEVLVVDDASNDRTHDIGCEYRRAHPEIVLTALRNEYNQGYGGNQKVGYTFAIREGFDFVVMLHGDGQYAPEELPRLVAPLRDGAADAVFGSRMMTRFDALKGGMPLYKYVGNRILTAAQNLLLGTSFTEFHSGYRVYSVAALKQIAYRLNSNDFHFDTEIIIQLLHARQRILELPIPTYYGDEICRVNGMKYAKDVMFATLRSVAHRAGILYQRRFDPINEHENAHYDLKLGYASSHQFALDAVPPGASVIDIGAGPGGLAGELQKKGCRVAVVDQFVPVEALHGDIRVFKQDLDQEPTFDVGSYRYLLLLDVIEHLKSPERFLERLRKQFDYSPKTLILTTPNVAFVIQRMMLAFGQFNYGKSGILDRTHTRLFTFRSLRQLLLDCGFRLKEVRGVPGPFPKVFGDGLIGRAAIAVNELLIRLSPSLFSYQIFVVAETTPDVDFVLDDAKRRSTVDALDATTGGSSTTSERDEGQRSARRWSPMLTNAQKSSANGLPMTMGVKPRIFLCVLVAVLAGAWSASLHVKEGSDFDNVVRGAVAYLSGADPYDVKSHAFYLLYPMTAVLFAIPFVFLPSHDFWFVGLGLGLFIWVATASPRFRWSLVVLVSPAMFQLVRMSQWSALVTAAALLPWWGWLLACKPTLGGALWLAFPSRISAIGAVAFALVSLALYPTWPWHWAERLATAFHVQAPVTFWGGPLILLALFYWRRWEARLLVALACVPQSGFYYELWPLFLIPQTVEAALYLLVASWLFMTPSIDWLLQGTAGYSAADLYLAERRAFGQVAVLLVYLPCLVMIWHSHRIEERTNARASLPETRPA